MEKEGDMGGKGRNQGKVGNGGGLGGIFFNRLANFRL